jgi:hypothetical protein
MKRRAGLFEAGHRHCRRLKSTADISAGDMKPANQKEYRRLQRNQNGKCKVVVVIRERGGNSVPAVLEDST